MAGLLSSGTVNAGLLGPLIAQATVGARKGMVPASAPPVAAPVQEHRVNPLRVALSTLISGTNPFDAYDAERLRPQREASARNRLQVEQGLLSMFGPQGGAAGGQAGVLPQVSGLAAPGGLPAAPRRGLPSLREVGPQLAAAQVLGVEGVSGLVNLLKETSPDIDVVNGVGYDRNDAGNVGRRIGTNLTNVNGFQVDSNNPDNTNAYFPDIPEGAEPVYDAQRRVIGMRGLNGAIEFLGQRQRATSDANNASTASYASAISGGQAAGQAPYQVETVTGPNGAPVTMSRAALLGGGGMVGQSPTEAIVAEGDARRDVARADALTARYQSGQRQLPILQEMEDNLEGAITGFAAGPRLLGARVLESLGNEDAGNAVQASQVFEQQAGKIVAEIIKTFGANPTEGERAYIEKISGANRDLSPRTLQEGIRLARESISRDEQAYRGLQGSRNQNTGGVTADQARAILRARGVPGY